MSTTPWNTVKQKTSLRKTVDKTLMKTLKEWAEEVYQVAQEKGWHPEAPSLTNVQKLNDYLMNIHSEISELWEAYRENKIFNPCDKAKSMVEMGLRPLNCAEEELADIVIRAFDTAESLGLDIAEAVATKNAYNKTRSHRHGGKLV